MYKIKELLKRMAEKAGLNIYALKNRFAPGYLFFKNRSFNTVIDAGANVGQFALKFHVLYPNAVFYSFEPLAGCFAQLKENTKRFGNIRCYNIGLGAKSETVEINKNDFSPASSILDNTESQEYYMPYTKGVSKERIQIKPLDDFLPDIISKGPVLLKIDVQGYERHLLEGATELLKRVDCVLVELSLEELYRGQPLFKDIYQMLTEQEFRYAGNFDQQISKQNGRIIQVDAIFTKGQI